VRNKGRRPEEKMRGKDRGVTNSGDLLQSSFEEQSSTLKNHDNSIKSAR
jgi:hypothetical protein